MKKKSIKNREGSKNDPFLKSCQFFPSEPIVMIFLLQLAIVVLYLCFDFHQDPITPSYTNFDKTPTTPQFFDFFFVYHDFFELKEIWEEDETYT